MAKFLNRLLSDSTGATAVEYGLVVALIAIATLGALWAVSGETNRMWNLVETRSVEAMTK